MKKYSLAIRVVAIGIITFLMLMVILLVLELNFRFKGEYGREAYVYDSHLIWRLQPNKKGVKPLGQNWENSTFTLKFNKYGFRGKALKKKKSADKKRVMVIGDSYTAGLDYPDDQTFTGLLEAKLNEGSSVSTYEVINASCPAWGSDQQYLYWETEGKAFDPDYLILMVSPNDLREMYAKKLVVLDGAGELKVNPVQMPFKNKLGWKLSNTSSLFQYFQKRHWNTNYGHFFDIFRFYPVNFGIGDSTDWDAPMFLKEPFKEVKESHQLFEKIVSEINEDCQEMGCKLLLSIIPTKMEFEEGKLDTTLYQAGAVANLIDTVAKNNKLPYLNLYEELKKEDDPLRIFFSWEYHFNDQGHHFTADRLYPFLKSNIE